MSTFKEANSYEIVRYKQTAISLLVNDADIVKTIDNKNVAYADDLIWTNIFPYIRVPKTEQEQQTYILMSVDMPNNTNSNNLMKDMTITFIVATHSELIKVDGKGCTRIDLLSHYVDRLFNGKDIFGIGELMLVSNLESALDNTHPCRTLKFKVMNFNNKNSYRPI